MNAEMQREVDKLWGDIIEYANRFWPRKRTETLHLVREELLEAFAEQFNLPGQTALFVPGRDKFLVVPDGPAWENIPLKDRPIITWAEASWLDYETGLYD